MDLEVFPVLQVDLLEGDVAPLQFAVGPDHPQLDEDGTVLQGPAEFAELPGARPLLELGLEQAENLVRRGQGVVAVFLEGAA